MSAELSVVIPTFNRATQLARALDALAMQDLDRARFEVIAVDDGSTDATSSVLAAARPYRLTAMRQANQGPAAARNAAVRAASARIVMFIDDDVIPAPNLLSAHLAAHAGPAPLVAIGAMLPPARGARQPVWSAWELRMLQKQYECMLSGRWGPTPRQFYTANASVPRASLLRAGLFDASFSRAEDMELAYRLEDIGLGFRFLPGAAVVHDTPRSLAAWLRLGADYGHYDVVLWRDKARRHLLPAMARECGGERHPALRALARLATGRAAPMRAIRLAGPLAIRAAAAAGLRSVAFAGCSAVFNLQYWDAVCAQLGRDAWWAAVDAASGREQSIQPTA